MNAARRINEGARSWLAAASGILRTRMLRSLALAGLVFVLLPGCANFKAASEFAGQTTKLTTVVKAEFTQIETICTQQAVANIVATNSTDDLPLLTCKNFKDAHGRLAEATVTVLDGFGKALAGLADDKSFDLSSDIKGIGTKLNGLKGADGKAIIDAKEVGVLTKLADLIVYVATYAKRTEAIEKMVQAAPDLQVTGQMLKSFFVAVPGVPEGRIVPPYRNQVKNIDIGNRGTKAILNGPALRKAEPIRTAELSRELDAREALLKSRLDDGPTSVPAKIVEVLDAWQRAVAVFERDALKPEPKDLYDQLKVLQEKASAARDAVEEKS